MTRNAALIFFTLVLASCSDMGTTTGGSNQLVTGVTNEIRRLDPTIDVPPLTPDQAGHLKMILDEPRRESSDWQKVQSIKAYLRKIS